MQISISSITVVGLLLFLMEEMGHREKDGRIRLRESWRTGISRVRFAVGELIDLHPFIRVSRLLQRHATGGEIPGLLPKLSPAELNVTQSANNTGNVTIIPHVPVSRASSYFIINRCLRNSRTSIPTRQVGVANTLFRYIQNKFLGISASNVANKQITGWFRLDEWCCALDRQ
jgi:hypothetical protein